MAVSTLLCSDFFPYKEKINIWYVKNIFLHLIHATVKWPYSKVTFTNYIRVQILCVFTEAVCNMCILQAHNDNKFGLAWVSILLSLCHTLKSAMTSFLKNTIHIWLIPCTGISLDISTSQKTKLQYENITYLNMKKKCYRNAMLLITASDVHMHTQHISGSLLATKTNKTLPYWYQFISSRNHRTHLYWTRLLTK